jgi:hypothetical protein
VRLVLHAIGGVISAAVVPAAFWAAVRLLAGRAFRRAAYPIITGAYTASLWRMTFGFAPPIEWDARVKGRGVVGIGEASSLIHHAQIAWLPTAERRRYTLTGPPPPDWHIQMRPAPWITPRVLAEGRKLAGASLVTIPRQLRARRGRLDRRDRRRRRVPRLRQA